MTEKRDVTALQLYGREVKVTRYDHGGARFYVDDENGRGLVADTYSLVATDWLIEKLTVQLPRHEWDDVRWVEEHGEYEAECWCGWTHMAYAYDAAEEALRGHLRENGAEVPA